ncbi:MAG: DUF952 domain-containing protein [Chloroflexota bacterium]|nr:DUF952 domain-containing protein [Chloroflexota bacterium]
MGLAGKRDRFEGTTFHLTPESIWRAQEASPSFEPEAFAREDFIHCTNGADEVLAVGNKYYRFDTRPYVVLELDVELVSAPIRYDDVLMLYPHIYGRVNREAIVAARTIERDPSGRFLAIR